MQRSLIGRLTLLLVLPVLVEPAIAQPRPVPLQLTPSQFQQLSGALVRSSSQDFFEQGRQRLEQEVKTLTERKRLMSEGVLKIREDLRLKSDSPELEQLRDLPR